MVKAAESGTGLKNPGSEGYKAKVEKSPRSLVTGDVLQKSSGESLIVDKFWALKADNDLAQVVPINAADASVKIWKEKSSRLFEDDTKRLATSAKHSGGASSSSSSGSGGVQAGLAPNAGAAMGDGSSALDYGAYLKEEEVLRVMKKILPTETLVSPECLKSMQRCAAEFISIITNEAGVITLTENQAHRIVVDTTASSRVMKGSDVNDALDALGFQDYAKVINTLLAKFKAQKSLQVYRPVVPAVRKLGMTYEEQLQAEGDILDSREEASRLKKKAKRH